MEKFQFIKCDLKQICNYKEKIGKIDFVLPSCERVSFKINN